MTGIRVRERGTSPLSARTRRKLLGELHRRAQAGEIAAMESLVRLSIGKRAKPGEERQAASEHRRSFLWTRRKVGPPLLWRSRGPYLTRSMLARVRHHERHGAGGFLLSWRSVLAMAPSGLTARLLRV